MTTITRQLQWPDGTPRTAYRRHAQFATSGPTALAHLVNEIRLLGGRDVVLSVDMPITATKLPRWDRWRRTDDPGVVVTFTLDREEMVIVCDRWTTPWDNLRAIGKTIEALRGIQRWGTEDMMRAAFAGYAALPAGGKPAQNITESITGDPWWIVLGVRQDATRNELDRAYRSWAKVHHPDTGGNPDRFREVTNAYQLAAREVRA